LLEKTLKSIEPLVPNPEKRAIFCIVCARPATNIVHYQIEAAIIVEKYRDKGVKKVEFQYRLTK
jgi:hypothetical protein